MLHYVAGGRKVRVMGVRLDFAEVTIDIESAMLDTGLDVAVFGPEEDVRSRAIDAPYRHGNIRGIAGKALPTQVRDTTVVLGTLQIPGELYTAPGREEWTLGLPVLRHFHLLLCDGDADVTAGPCLVAPPLLGNLRG